MTATFSTLTVSVIVGLIMSVGAASAGCPGVDQQEMNRCAAADYQKADAELTKVYGKLDKTPELRAAERAWIAYRDAECAFANSDSEGGTIHSMEVTLCEEKLTNIRAQQLRSYLKCGEGDMGCPVPAK